MRRCHLGVMLLFCALASMARGEVASSPRCGLLIDRSLQESPAATLFEASFVHDPGIIAIERAEIDKVLQEQQVQAMFSADAIGRRSAFGKILKADLLVLIRQVSPPPSAHLNPEETPAVPAIEMVVCETHRGLRLLAEIVPSGDEPAGDVDRLTAAFHRGLARSHQRLETIVAVPPFSSLNLTHDLDYLEDVYPRLVQEVLFNQPGVLVVEIPEAKALADEIALAGGEQVKRDLPFYLTGSYRHEGVGAKARVTVTLELSRGGITLDKATFDGLSPNGVPDAVRSAVWNLLKTAGTSPAKTDLELEARELADKSDAFARVGDWHQARVLAEASLLLEPHNARMHGVAYQSLNELAIQVGGDTGHMKDVSKALGYFQESLAHLEPYIDGKQFTNNIPGPWEDFSVDGFWKTIRWEVLANFDPPAQPWIDADREARETVWRALHRKSAARVDDNTVERFYSLLTPQFQTQSKFSPAPDPAVVAATASARRSLRLSLLRDFSYRRNAKNFFHLMIQGSSEETADPQWPAFLAEASKIPNPEIAQALAEIRAEASQAKVAPNDPPTIPSVAVADTEIVFEKLKIALPRVADPQDITQKIVGCMPISGGIDILWTPHLIFVMKQKGVLTEPLLGPCSSLPKDESDANVIGPSPIWLSPKGACFDGQFVWFIVTTAPAKSQRLVAIDVKRSKIIWLGKKQGLPPGAQAITGLAPGKICVGGDFGRSWCAIASADPDIDGGVPLKVIYEARETFPETIPRDGSSLEKVSSAYPIQELHALIPESDAANARRANLRLPRVLVQRFGQQFFLLDPNTGAIEKVACPLTRADTASVYGDTIYWIGLSAAFHGSCMSRSVGPNLIPDARPWAVPMGSFICDADGVGHFIDYASGAWLVSRSGTPPLRILRGEPVKISSFSRICSSNLYGLIIFDHTQGMLQVRFPKPLPEATPPH